MLALQCPLYLKSYITIDFQIIAILSANSIQQVILLSIYVDRHNTRHNIFPTIHFVKLFI